MNEDETTCRGTGGLAGLILIAALTRVVPRPANFTAAALAAFPAIVPQASALASLTGG